MRAIVFDAPGDESVLRLGEVSPPTLGPGDVRLAVRATALNRADLLQRKGLYPPPPGASSVLGLEAAGEIVEVGDGVEALTVGQRAMALLAGGGYAEEAVVPQACVMPIPERLSWFEAAAVPEAFLTAYSNLFLLARLDAGETVLVHGGSSGVGTAAIQLIVRAGARAIVTVRDHRKAERCRALGAETILYPEEDFAVRVAELTSGRGVDVVLDCMGAVYLERNLASLAMGGRLVVIGLQGGARAPLDLAAMLSRRLTVIGSTLRSRPVGDKGQIVRSFEDRFGADLDAGAIAPVVDRVLPLADAAEAHRVMARSDHIGKIVLAVR